mgnify:CR=1 FL=1
MPLVTFFHHTDLSSYPEFQKPHIGDYLKIKVPLPSLENEIGFDWVMIEKITDEEIEHFKRVSIVLRPADDPTSETKITAHFFKPSATSTICVEQHKHTVVVIYAGRNQEANTVSDNLAVKLRNAAITLGAKLGASYPQWKSLVKGIIRA